MLEISTAGGGLCRYIGLPYDYSSAVGTRCDVDNGAMGLQVTFHAFDRDAPGGARLTGAVHLVSGKAVPDEAKLSAFLADWVVVEPGTPERTLTPDDGFAYMRAIPYNLRGAYSYAAWDHDGLGADDLADHIARLKAARTASTVDRSLPVLFFGDLTTARVVTVALNPSDREYLERDRRLLTGSRQRFATLDTYEASSRGELRDIDCMDAIAWMRAYFLPDRPAYWPYFSHLERFLEGAGYGYQSGTAAHLDLVQEPTTPVWRYLPPAEREAILERDLPFLELLLRSRPIEAVFCNGKTVSETLRRRFRIVELGSGALGRLRWWVGDIDLDGRSLPAAGWNYPLNQATGLDGDGEIAFGRLIARELAAQG
jgi:hypothetical protein